MVSHGPGGKTTELGLTPSRAGGGGRTGREGQFGLFTDTTSAAVAAEEDNARLKEDSTRFGLRLAAIHGGSR